MAAGSSTTRRTPACARTTSSHQQREALRAVIRASRGLRLVYGDIPAIVDLEPQLFDAIQDGEIAGAVNVIRAMRLAAAEELAS
jgi:hypothetical protein